MDEFTITSKLSRHTGTQTPPVTSHRSPIMISASPCHLPSKNAALPSCLFFNFTTHLHVFCRLHWRASLLVCKRAPSNTSNYFDFMFPECQYLLTVLFIKVQSSTADTFKYAVMFLCPDTSALFGSWEKCHHEEFMVGWGKSVNSGLHEEKRKNIIRDIFNLFGVIYQVEATVGCNALLSLARHVEFLCHYIYKLMSTSSACRKGVIDKLCERLCVFLASYYRFTLFSSRIFNAPFVTVQPLPSF